MRRSEAQTNVTFTSKKKCLFFMYGGGAQSKWGFDFDKSYTSF